MKPVTMDTMQEKLINRFFRKVDDACWDLMTGKMGVTTNEGIMTLEGQGEDAQVVLNMFDQFSVKLPAFAQNTPMDQIRLGDLIYTTNGGVHGWVVDKKPKSLVLLKPNGNRGTWQPTKIASMGMQIDGAMVLRNLMNMVGGDGLAGMQNQLLPLMMMSGGDGLGAMEDMLPIMLFSQMGGVNAMNGGTPAVEAKPATYKRDASGNLELDADGNPIMLTPPVAAQPAVPAQVNNNGGFGNMMQTMLMMQLMNGGRSNNGRKSNFFDGTGR